MTNPLVFLDTETTGLQHDCRPWEIALIRRETSGYTSQLVIYIDDVDLSAAELIGLKIGKFYDHHPSFRTEDPIRLEDSDELQLSPGTWLATEAKAAELIERTTRHASLVGANPGFDANCLAALLRRNRLTPAWHYHPIDIESLAMGHLHALSEQNGTSAFAPLPPVSSDKLSRLCGVEPPTAELQHTALGDALWVQDWYDKLTTHA